MIKLISRLIVFTALLAPALSHATCTLFNGQPIPVVITVNVNPSFIDTTVPIGATMYATYVAGGAPIMGMYTLDPSQAGAVYMHCVPGGDQFMGEGTLGAPGPYQTYPTGIPGVGVRMAWYTYIGDPNYSIFPYTWSNGSGNPNYPLFPFTNPTPVGTQRRTVFATLIKTGEITSTGALTGEFGQVTIGGTKIVSIVWSGGAIIDPGLPTCTIMGNDTVSVPLPTLKSGDFNISPNPSGGNSQPITLAVGNCLHATSATFTFSGTAEGNTPYFKNTGTATGVAVRLYRADTGQTIGANGTTNVYPIQITGSQASLSVGAQYYKTGASVGAGSVISKATVTMSYN